MAGQVNYSSSKAGMIGFTKALAKEIAKANVTVNALALGFVETDMTGVLNAGLSSQGYWSRFRWPIRKTGRDGRNCAVPLVAEGGYITGQVVQVDGGLAI